MLTLTTHEHVQVYTETLYALARDARAQRNDAALAFIGGYLKNLVPEKMLEVFRDELRRLPAQSDVKNVHNVVAELEAYRAQRDKAPPKEAPSVLPETAGIEF